MGNSRIEYVPTYSLSHFVRAISLVPPPLQCVKIRIQHYWAYEDSVEGDGLHQPPELFPINRFVGARLDLVPAIRSQS